VYSLYPRLPLAVAEKLAQERATLSIEELAQLSGCAHHAMQYAPTGGNRVSSEWLGKLQQTVRECAQKYGYPNLADDSSSRDFDVQCGSYLYEKMRLHSSEASHLEMWVFMTCILLPDVVRWRFPGDATSIERFIGSDRGLRRNVFGRLWWRSFLLYQPDFEDPYTFLNKLFEDDLVQITERNSIAANRVLLKTFCTVFLQVVEQRTEVPRRAIIREASKRTRRLLSLIAFDVLDDPVVGELLERVFSSTLASLNETDADLP
jgi:hypothetical protein